MSETEQKTLAGVDGVTRLSQLPPHFPTWASTLAELYFSGTTSTFVLHGNVFDVVRAGQPVRLRSITVFGGKKAPRSRSSPNAKLPNLLNA